MKSRLLAALILTICYWPLALIVMGMVMMGDCFEAAAVCEAAFAQTRVIALSVAVGLYALLLCVVIRRHGPPHL